MVMANAQKPTETVVVGAPAVVTAASVVGPSGPPSFAGPNPEFKEAPWESGGGKLTIASGTPEAQQAQLDNANDTSNTSFVPGTEPPLKKLAASLATTSTEGNP